MARTAVTLSISMPPELWSRLDAAAGNMNVSRSALATALLTMGLERMEAFKDEKTGNR